MTQSHENPAITKTEKRDDKPPSLWKNQDYMGWWIGNTVSILGTSMSAIAFPLLVLYTTHSVARAGVVTAAEMIGSLITTLVGGALADRVSRKAIMILSPLVQGTAMAVVAVFVSSGRSPIALLTACAGVSGLAFGLGQGATTPALRRIVPKEQQANATAQEIGRDMAAQIIGSPLGGIFFALSRWIPFAADAISFAFASLGAAIIRRPLGPDRRVMTTRTSTIADIKSGFSFVRKHPFLRFVVIWASLFNAITQGFILLFIALVRYRGGGPDAVGVISAVALFGGLAGAVIGPLLLQWLHARNLLYAAIWVFIASFLAVAVVPTTWAIGIVLLIAMLGVAPLNMVMESYQVRLVPDAFSGRVSAVNRFGAQSLQWCGPLLAGYVADLLTPPGAAIVFMALLVPLALALHFSKSLGILVQPVDQVSELDPLGAVRGAPQHPETAPG